MKHRHIVDFPSTLMFALLVTVLALVLPLIAYARYHASRHISPIPDQAVEPEIDAPSSESPRTAHIMADPATKPNDDRMQPALRGDRAVQPQLPATQNPIQRPVPAVLPVDDTTDITPLEKRMMDAMNTASSEQFQYVRECTRPFFTSHTSITTPIQWQRNLKAP
jgi:hypothetical protein